MTTLYGLKNCETCKKAQAWLAAHGIEHRFIDYRAQPLNADEIDAAAAAIGWERLVNRSSTTWRQLDENAKSAATPAEWLALLQANPTLMRRPLLVGANGFEAGFSTARYQALFGAETPRE